MSTIEKVGTQAGATCVGAFALALGDPSGAPLAATGALGLVAIALAKRVGCVDRACGSAKGAAIAALEASPDFRDMNLTRVETLLAMDAKDLSRADLIAATRAENTPEAMAELLLARVTFDGDTQADREAVRLALEAAMHACGQDADFKTELRDVRLIDMQAEVLELRRTAATKNDLSAMEARLMTALRGSASDKTKAMLAEREKLVIALAEKYAEGSPGDFDAALAGLQRALELAAKRAPGGNLKAEIGVIMAEVDRLNDEGRIDEGAAALARKRAEMRADEERQAAAYLDVLDRSIDQAILGRDVGAAADLSVEKVKREGTPGADRFDSLRILWNEWYERGRDKGLRFDLEVSIALARAYLARAEGPDQRGAAGNDLGAALSTLGERESGTARLEEAANAFRAALEEYTRDRVPLDWALTQENMAMTERALAEKSDGAAAQSHLARAIAHVSAALEVFTPDQTPFNHEKATRLLDHLRTRQAQ